MRYKWVLLTLTYFLWEHAQCFDNGVGRTPAMGWNSWNFFRCNINESLIREVADALVSSGLRDAGYVYVNMDDCWMEKRDEHGVIMPFASKFPSGLKALADYVHSKGLKFGLYSDTGNHTCEGYPGSWGYEKQDAETYASWGVDYLKYDYCGMEKAMEPPKDSYKRMQDALNSTNRPILLSICNWGSGAPHTWGREVGHSWRTGIDVFAAWDSAQAKALKLPNFLQPVLSAVAQEEAIYEFAGPGGFNDLDMLVVGLDGMYPYGIVDVCPEHIVGCTKGMYVSRERWGSVGGLTHTEQKAHFSFWCMLASPLILGNDPRHMSKSTLSILTAKELIAISQDTLGKQARKVWEEGDLQIWVKMLAAERIAALLFNRGDHATDITMVWNRDVKEAAQPWLKPDASAAAQECKDKHDLCKNWAEAGECKKNPGFMFDGCKKSCPEACPQPLEPPGPKATATVRDAWLEEDQGLYTGSYKARFVEPHEARVVVLHFVDPEKYVAATQLQPAQSNGEYALMAERMQQQFIQQQQQQQGGAGGSLGDTSGGSAAEVQQLLQQIRKLGADLKTAQTTINALHSAQTDEGDEMERELRDASVLRPGSSGGWGLYKWLSHSYSGVAVLLCAQVALVVGMYTFHQARKRRMKAAKHRSKLMAH